MKRLAWLTDIHLNFVTDEDCIESLVQEIKAAGSDAILIGGDIGEAPTFAGYLENLESSLDVPIYFVLGNHDYYGGSIPHVRGQMLQLCSEHPGLNWLPETGVVKLTRNTALVGAGGWGDARCGQWNNTTVELNDYKKIKELAEIDKHGDLGAKLRELGDEQARILKASLDVALASYKRVIVLTHVPPFQEAAWHLGNMSDWNWAPHFTCKAVGDMLLEVAGAHIDQTIHVLCGHTHSAGYFWARPNLLVTTGAAVYGNPAVQPPILVP
jgi:3',5'-cyclic AMP phosphodiesterase CpdA